MNVPKVKDIADAVVDNKNELLGIYHEIIVEHPEITGLLAVLIDPEAPGDLKIDAIKMIVGFNERRIRMLEQQVSNLASLIADNIKF